MPEGRKKKHVDNGDEIMKKIEKFAQKCYESYFHAKTGWFLGAILSLTMLPRVLRALWMI